MPPLRYAPYAMHEGTAVDENCDGAGPVDTDELELVEPVDLAFNAGAVKVPISVVTVEDV